MVGAMTFCSCSNHQPTPPFCHHHQVSERWPGFYEGAITAAHAAIAKAKEQIAELSIRDH